MIILDMFQVPVGKESNTLCAMDLFIHAGNVSFCKGRCLYRYERYCQVLVCGNTRCTSQFGVQEHTRCIRGFDRLGYNWYWSLVIILVTIQGSVVVGVPWPTWCGHPLSLFVFDYQTLYFPSSMMVRSTPAKDTRQQFMILPSSVMVRSTPARDTMWQFIINQFII